MSEPRSTKAYAIVLIFLVSTLAPFVSADGDSPPGDVIENFEPVFGDINQMVYSEAHPYMVPDSDEKLYSATRLMKNAWVDQGMPGVDVSTSPQALSTSGRACTPYSTGDSLNVPTSGGSIDVTVKKTTSTAAFMVQDGRTLSSTILNNWASTWDQTVYPTLMSYFGKDYFDGRGIAAPDVDNNCQIEVVIYAIDGAYNTGGYFAPGMSSSREAIFIDIDDAPLTWSKVILAHELQHLLHNALDPYENLWIDEGAADMAAFLCFGGSSTLYGHVNAWTEASETSVRWWNQRIADYGGGFIFLLYLADHLGGGPAIRKLVQDSATGGVAIENLARNPIDANPGVIGRNYIDIFTNFTIASTLDSDQGIYGLSNLYLTPVCGSSDFCRIQPADTNSDWMAPWTSTGNSIEGWGVRVFKFIPGGAAPAPLTMRFTGDQVGMDGVIMSRASTDGTYTRSDINFNGAVGTALVPGFGNVTDEIWAITWFASNKGDCDYTSCGSSYPQGIIDVEAARITSPAELTMNGSTSSDRDGDSLTDTIQLGFDVLSNAFFEDLDVTIEAKNSSGVIVDTIQSRVQAGGGSPVTTQFWFTSPSSELYSFDLTMRDMLGDVIDYVQSSPIYLDNMAPVANSSIDPVEAQTWDNIQFMGDGFDAWGLSYDNNTLPNLDLPVAYAWDYNDGNTSSLKSPVRSFTDVGQYNVSLRVKDSGGTWSLTDIKQINITDSSEPIPVITVAGQIIEDNYTILTGQRILFDASRTSDNVPISHLTFTWDWGDGSLEGGKGLSQANHLWADGLTWETSYNLTLWISDGVNTVSKVIEIIVRNRAPGQIFNDMLTIETYTPLSLPDVFEDVDGDVVSWTWAFEEGVNLEGGILDRTDLFVDLLSNEQNPIAAWNKEGLKNVSVTVTDDDGNVSSTLILVNVLNQHPVAQFTVRDSSSAGSPKIDFRYEDGEVDVPYTYDGRESYDPDGTSGDSSVLEFQWEFSDGIQSNKSLVTHNFTEPGEHWVILTVIDESGQVSEERKLTIRINNPKPVIQVRILDAWLNGVLINSSTPMAEGTQPSGWSHTFDDDGNVVTTVDQMLFFDSAGTRDGDRKYEGRFVPLESNHSDWNGIVEYSWDFGDATPISHESMPWHHYERSGTYKVTLTVRDSYLTGDVTRSTFTIIVNEAPVIHEIILPEEIRVGESVALNANVTDSEALAEYVIWRDLDVNDGLYTDRDERVSSEITVRWEYDIDYDSDMNGIVDDDWETPSGADGIRIAGSWDEVGLSTLRLSVCDGMGVCSTQDYEVTILAESKEPPSLSDFSLQDWKDWLVEAGSESFLVLALIVAVLILGWAVMRSPTEVEEEAEQAAQTYDVEEVQSFGGVLGLDQHKPPPAPKILSKEERRSESSGYVRPLRRRR
ncbi:MAG: PKD domain-containing protein [Candidatus Poseidoniaceae archaeon]|jgi:PKD repeat protein|nr:PKD domain-containing protein [Candidatus Poseidoniaceae archaeon]